MEPTRDKLCERHLIPGYIDGELEVSTLTLFEGHLENCATCRAELRRHQQFICELDAVLANDVEVLVPPNFSRVVAARAVSDMSGVRSASENKKAVIFCLILAFAGFALIGGTTRQLAVSLGRRLVGKIFGVIDLAWNALYDSIASLAVISRVLSRKFIFETGNLGVALLLLALAVLLLSRLISSYHRTGTTE
jgi:predicted anti-sigma-YlaC factor YlaD